MEEDIKMDFLNNVLAKIENYKKSREKYLIAIANSLSDNPEFYYN